MRMGSCTGKYLDVDVFNAYYYCRDGLSPQVTLESLQIGGPFKDSASFSAAMIENHQLCMWLIDLVCPMRALSECLRMTT